MTDVPREPRAKHVLVARYVLTERGPVFVSRPGVPHFEVVERLKEPPGTSPQDEACDRVRPCAS